MRTLVRRALLALALAVALVSPTLASDTGVGKGALSPFVAQFTTVEPQVFPQGQQNFGKPKPWSFH